MAHGTVMQFYDPEAAARNQGLRDQLVDRMRSTYLWQEVPCVLCGPGAPSSYAVSKYGIDLRRCDWCDHLFVSPRLPEEAVPDLYGNAYWDDYARGVGSPTLEDRVAYDYQNGFGKLGRDVLPHRTGGRLLDVGASNGGMVRAARDRGFAAEGVEPSPETCAIAKRAHDIDLHCWDVRHLGLPARTFDVVTMHDVLEHLFEPIEVLRECRRLLAPGGLLVLETPTTDSLDFLVQGIGWADLSPLEHVNLFSEANAARAVRLAGFSVVDLYCPHENNVVVVAEATVQSVAEATVQSVAEATVGSGAHA